MTRPGGAPRRSGRRPQPRATPIADGQCSIDSLAHGGAGVGRWQGRVLFVPGAVPGDRIRASEVQWRDRGAFGQVARFELLSPSPLRRPALCPHRPLCGGCPWHEIEPAARGQAKIDDALAQLQRIARIDAAGVPRILQAADATRWGKDGHSIVRVEPDWGYRLRARLHIGRAGDQVRAGYLEQGTDNIVDIEQCGLLLPALAAPTLRALALARARRWPAGQLHVAIGLEPAATAAAFVANRGCAIDQVLADLRAAGFDNAEVTERATGRTQSTGVVDLRGVVAPGAPGGPFAHGPRTFVQAHAAGNRGLVDAVVRCAGEVEARAVLELHAGAGNFTLPLAHTGAHVRAVEFEIGAVGYLRQNLDRADLSSQVEVIASDAAALAQWLGATAQPVDLLLLDPPRTGYRELEMLLSTIEPKRIIYCSCDAATLARDCRSLSTRGFRLTRFDALDMMPNSWHAELIAVFDREPPQAAAEPEPLT